MKIPQNVCAIDSVANNSSFAASGQSTNFSWFDQHRKTAQHTPFQDKLF